MVIVNVDLYSASSQVSNALCMLVPREQPGLQALFKRDIVLLCVEVVRQGVPDHGTVYSKCSAANSGESVSWHHPQLLCRWPESLPTDNIGVRWPVCNSQQDTMEPCHANIYAWWRLVCMWLDLPHRASVGHRAKFWSGNGQTFLCVTDNTCGSVHNAL